MDMVKKAKPKPLSQADVYMKNDDAKYQVKTTLMQKPTTNSDSDSGSGCGSSSKIQNYMDDCRNIIGFNEIRIEGKVCGQSFKWHITSIYFKMQI